MKISDYPIPKKYTDFQTLPLKGIQGEKCLKIIP